MPLAASIGAAPSVTVAVMPEEQVVPVTVPFAQYVKESEPVPTFGVYVNVPLALSASVPPVGAARS